MDVGGIIVMHKTVDYVLWSIRSHPTYIQKNLVYPPISPHNCMECIFLGAIGKHHWEFCHF
jgi:hypothetical protein